ncbi:MAG: hypothetical protein C0468_05485 [Planctomyces sp.]|nr:hypothetical protein [Planctomyces sp.]
MSVVGALGVGPARPGLQAGGRGAAAPAATGWTIVLATFRGEGKLERARQALPEVARLAGLGGLFVEERGRAAIIGHGRFDDPRGDDAGAALGRVRALRVGASQPFRNAFLTPPIAASIDQGRPEHSLVRAREQFGSRAEVTLQVAAYGGPNPRQRATPAELREARVAAERAAEVLRQEGELAFYYHGPSLSLVTIGVFEEGAVAAGGRPESPELAALRQRFPHNLYNGSGLKEFRGGVEQLMPSFVVGIPER